MAYKIKNQIKCWQTVPGYCSPVKGYHAYSNYRLAESLIRFANRRKRIIPNYRGGFDVRPNDAGIRTTALHIARQYSMGAFSIRALRHGNVRLAKALGIIR